MKKVLFATTALVASAGFAAAQGVELSGSAEMGVFGLDADNVPGPLVDGLPTELDADQDLQFHTDIDVTFTMAGETDTGLVFGADVDLDEGIGDGGDAGDNDAEDGGASFFVSGAFGTLTMGDTDGALDWALAEAIIGGSIQDDHEHAGYNGNAALDGIYDGQIARYEYSFGDFSIAGSAEIDDSGDGDPALGIGVRYAASFGGTDIGLGFGYQTLSDLDDLGDVVDDVDFFFEDEEDPDTNFDIFGVSADFEVAGVQVILNYSDYDGLPIDVEIRDQDLGTAAAINDHYGIALGYSFDALTVAANYGKFDVESDGVDDIDGYGLVANYDLGGGAELQAGYGHSEAGDADVDTYSFGISMAF